MNLSLEQRLRKDDFEKVREISESAAEKAFSMWAKQKVKFEARLLKQEERFNSVRENKGWLVNLRAYI